MGRDLTKEDYPFFEKWIKENKYLSKNQKEEISKIISRSENIYKCKCGESFSDKNEFLSHASICRFEKEEFGESEKMSKCPYCKKKTLLKNLEDHIVKTHRNKFRESIDEEEKIKKRDLNRDISNGKTRNPVINAIIADYKAEIAKLPANTQLKSIKNGILTKTAVRFVIGAYKITKLYKYNEAFAAIEKALGEGDTATINEIVSREKEITIEMVIKKLEEKREIIYEFLDHLNRS